jgi:hypothetical protein
MEDESLPIGTISCLIPGQKPASRLIFLLLEEWNRPYLLLNIWGADENRWV